MGKKFNNKPGSVIKIDQQLLAKITSIIKNEKEMLLGIGKSCDIYLRDCGRNMDYKPDAKIKKRGFVSMKHLAGYVDSLDHCHDYIQLIYICSGSAVYIIDGKKIHLSQGEVFILNRSVKHSVKRSKKSDVSINFIISPKFIDNLLSELQEDELCLKKFIMQLLDNSCARNFHFKVIQGFAVQNLIENIIMTLMNDNETNRVVDRTTVKLLLQTLLDYTESISCI